MTPQCHDISMTLQWYCHPPIAMVCSEDVSGVTWRRKGGRLVRGRPPAPAASPTTATTSQHETLTQPVHDQMRVKGTTLWHKQRLFNTCFYSFPIFLCSLRIATFAPDQTDLSVHIGSEVTSFVFNILIRLWGSLWPSLKQWCWDFEDIFCEF